MAWHGKTRTVLGRPIGEKIADAIEKGYSSRAEPYHGYFFKILKRQGPAAARRNGLRGERRDDRGFALVAAPAEYGVTGVKSSSSATTALSIRRLRAGYAQ